MSLDTGDLETAEQAAARRARCPNCGESDSTEFHETQSKIYWGDVSQVITYPAGICYGCGQQWLDDRYEDATMDVTANALAAEGVFLLLQGSSDL